MTDQQAQALRLENAALKKQIAALQKKIEELNAQLYAIFLAENGGG